MTNFISSNSSASNQIDTEVASQEESPSVESLGQEEECTQLYDVISTREDFPVPVTSCNSYVVEPIVSQEQVEIDSQGMKIINDDGIVVHAPMYVFCCIKGETISYEVKLLSGSRWEGNSITFSSPCDLEKSVPDSFFDCVEYLKSQIPGCNEALHSLLIDLTSHLCLLDKYTDDLGWCNDFLNSLHANSIAEKEADQSQEPPELDQCDTEYRYIVDNKWVATGDDGSIKLAQDDQAISYLADWSVNAYLAQNADCVIAVNNAKHTGNKTVTCIRSKSDFPKSFPAASLQAVQYLQEKYPENEDHILALVIGATSWLLFEDHLGDLGELYSDTADLYEECTGKVVNGIKALDGDQCEWETSYQ